MSAVSVSESGVRPILADAVDLARRALLELEPAGVGAHLGVAAEDDSAATHRFEATLPGYRGWQWAVVVAAPPEADYATVSESALLPGPDALVAPDFVPWDQRVRPGDLAPGDLLAPPPNDPRLVPGYVANGDPAVDEVATEIGLGRTQVLSLEGREMAAERWYGEFGPDTEMAKAAPSTCGLCGFYLPLAGSLRAAFGVCGNAMGADGHVVHAAYGCGAHSDTVAPTGGGSPLYEAFDDAAVELIPAEELAPVKETPAAEADAAQVADTAVETPAVEVEAAATDAVAPVVETPDASVASEADTAAENVVVVAETTPTGEAPSAEAASADAPAAESVPNAETTVAEADSAVAAGTETPTAVADTGSAAAGDADGSDFAPSVSVQAGDEGGSAAAVTESASDTAAGDAVAEGESSVAAEPSAAGSAADEAVVARATDESGVAPVDAESPVDNSGEVADDAAAQADDAEVVQASSGDEQVADGAAEAAEGRAVESSPQN